MPPDRRDSLSSQLPGTWQLESRFDVTASGERRPSLRSVKTPSPSSSTIAPVTSPRNS